MGILSEEQLQVLIDNGKKKREGINDKEVPVVLLRLPNNPPAAWMLSSVDPDNHDKAYGLIETGIDPPELGYVSLSELEMLRGYKEKGVYHDPMFKHASRLDIKEYADIARMTGQITLQLEA